MIFNIKEKLMIIPSLKMMSETKFLKEIKRLATKN